MRLRTSARAVALALLAAAIFYVLVTRAGLSGAAIIQGVGDLTGLPILCVAALTFGNLAFGTFKWLLVVRALTPDHGESMRFIDAMLATTVGAMLGQIMPVQVGVGAVRMLAARLGIGRSPALNLGTTAYEQLFDAVVLCIAGAIGFSGFALLPDAAGWAALTLGWGALGMAVALHLPSLIRIISVRLGRKPLPRRSNGLLGRIAAAAERAGELPRPLVARLILLSILRYITILVRIAVILWALDMSAFAARAVIAFPLLQTVALVPITPGNLGILEWSWSAVLVSGGATMSAAALFAVANRIVNVIAQFSLVVLLLLFRLLQGAWRYVTKCDFSSITSRRRTEPASGA